MEREKVVKWLNRFSLIVFLIIVGIALYIMKNGIGLIDGLDFGPGSYYYTDIPNWKQIFLVEDSISFTAIHPIYYAGFFLGWGFLMWKVWNYLEVKMK